MNKNKINYQSVIDDYVKGESIEIISLKYKIAILTVKDILINNNIKIRTLEEQREVINSNFNEKYPPKEGYHYIAKYKSNGKEFNDYKNLGGFLTSYIRKQEGIEIPSLHFRQKYFVETGSYWWEQWFDIVLVPDKPVKTCPYCGWTTTDVTNRTGCFEVHLKQKHNISKMEYLKEFPDEKSYFALVNPVLNRQMSDNEDEYVVCAICGRKLARINNTHLIKHGITRSEYIQKYGYKDVVSKQYYNTLLQQSLTMNLALENKPDKFTSKPEQEIIQFLKNIKLTGKKNRKLLNGKEIDIFIAEKNLGIEFNGNIHHTEWFGGKTRMYHLNKTKQCKEKGVKLIQIFEDEFYISKEIVFNKLAHILGVQQNLPKIMGRKCIVKEIGKGIAQAFLETFHIQGYDPSTVHYGAYYNDELIAVMSFLRSKKNCNDWELTRFASNFNYICQGVGGKLFKHFVKEYKPDTVKSFADRRWTVDEENNLYIQLGFKFDSYVAPDYKYYNSHVDKYKRFHKFGFRKKSLLKKYPDDLTPDMTETEMAKKLGYDRIWDCGLIKYIWRRGE